MLTHLAECHVDAYELQGDMHETAKILTDRCGLASRVQHIHGNFLESNIAPETYNAIVSFLVFLHIEDRATLFRKCQDVLCKDGFMYVEDFIRKSDREFTAEELEMLSRDVAVGHPLPTLEQLQEELSSAGLDMVQHTDMTEAWNKYTGDRYVKYEQELDRHIRVHGKEAVEGLQTFYRSVQRLFTGGTLGGIVYAVRKR